MADEPVTTAPATIPEPALDAMEVDKPEEPAQAKDVAPQEEVPAAEDGITSAQKDEGPSKVNGEEEPEPTDMGGKPSTSAEAEASPGAQTVETPTAKKGTTNGGSKKKAAVPEHKSKKLNKKKSMSRLDKTNLDAQPGQYFFARMKGHPPWPSVVCDEEMLPHSLLSSRPVTARSPDQTFRKPEYADGGKRAHERTFPIMFLHTNEFAWMPNTELTKLDPEDELVKAPSEKGKSKALLAAFAKAAENNDIQHFKTMLLEHQKALQQDIEDREALAAEKEAAKKAKKSRKSSEVVAGGGDEMDVDDDEAAEKPKSKKRKKADEDDADEKPAKTPKTGAKLKLSTPKAPAAAAAEPSTKKKSTTKSRAKPAKSSSEDDAGTPKVEEKPVTPEQAKEMKERKVLYYRHKLQRGLLSRDSIPKEDEMKPMSEFLGELEEYPDLEGSIIRVTKIHKVLKQILKLNSIPLEEEFHFKDRSRDLLAKWNETLSNDPAGAGDKEEGKEADEPKTPALLAADTAAPAATTNGDSSKPAENGDKEDEKVEAAAAPETLSEEKLENKIGTTTEGAKEADVPKAEAKAQEPAESAAEKKDDGPAVESAPAAEFKPAPAVATETAA